MAKIRFPTRIANATDHEESGRYALRGTLVTPEGFAVATDGRIAACVKVQVDELKNPAMVPQELGPKSKADVNAEYQLNGGLKCEKHTLVKGQTRVEQAHIRDGRFPKVGEILSKIDPSKHIVLPINAEFLWQLARAITVPDTSNVVALLIPAPDKGGLVTNVVGVLSNQESCTGEDAGGFGIIMPVDAEAAKVRTDFKKFIEAAAASLDAAAKNWSNHYVGRSRKEQDAAAEKGTDDTEPAAPVAGNGPQPKSRRQGRRKRHVA